MTENNKKQMWPILTPIIVAVVAAMIPTLLWLGALKQEVESQREEIQQYATDLKQYEEQLEKLHNLAADLGPNRIQWGSMEQPKDLLDNDMQITFEHKFDTPPIVIVSGQYSSGSDEPFAVVHGPVTETGFNARLITNAAGQPLLPGTGSIYWFAISR